MADGTDPVQFTGRAAKRITAATRIVEGWIRGHPAPRRRPVPGDDYGEIEFGKPTAAFKTGATITLNPVTDAGVDNGLDNVVIWLASDRSVVETPYATGDILSFVRLAAPYDHDADEDTASIDGILVGFQVGSHASPTTCSVTPEGTETAGGTAWDRANQAGDGCTVNVISRVAYNHAGDKKLYGFFQTLTFDATGKLADVSTETRYEIDAAEDCP